MPKSTSVAPARFVPVIVTVVPPPKAPLGGETPVIVGVAVVSKLVGRGSRRSAWAGDHGHVDRAGAGGDRRRDLRGRDHR